MVVTIWVLLMSTVVVVMATPVLLLTTRPELEFHTPICRQTE